MKGGIFIILLIFFYIAISFLFSLFIFSGYLDNGFINFTKTKIKDIETIGELLLGIFCILAWLFSVVLYVVYKILCNKFTVKLMNIKIRK